MKINKTIVLAIALLILVALFGFFGGRAVSKYREEIASLKSANKGLQERIAEREGKISEEQAKVVKLERSLDSLMQIFNDQGRKVATLVRQRDEALAKLTGITSDSTYQFLQQVAYAYPGTLKFLFNELQIRHIHEDYIVARSSETIIPSLSTQIENCKDQFAQRDQMVVSLNEQVALKDASIKDLNKAIENDQKVMKDLESTADKERHRKGFWRISTAVMSGLAVVLLIGL